MRSLDRELKLRAATASEYQAWMRALAPLANQNSNAAHESERADVSERLDDEGDDDDGDGEEEPPTSLPSIKEPEAEAEAEADPHGLGPAISSSAPRPSSSKAAPPFTRAASTSNAAPPPLDHRKSFDSLYDDDDDWEPPQGGKDGGASSKRESGGNWLTRLFSPRASEHSSEGAVSGVGDSPPSASNPFGDGGGGGGSGGGGGGGNPFGGGSGPASLKVEPQPHKRPSLSHAGADGLSGFYQDDDDDDDDEPPAAASSSNNPFGSASGASSANTPFGAASGSSSFPRTMGAGSGGLAPEGTPFKIIIVGDSGVGKTSLVVRFVEGRYDGREAPTVAPGVSNAALDLGSSTVGLSLWDTAGQERFAPLSAPYFRQVEQTSSLSHSLAP